MSEQVRNDTEHTFTQYGTHERDAQESPEPFSADYSEQPSYQPTDPGFAVRPIIDADQIELTGDAGTYFGPVSFEVPGHGLTVIKGSSATDLQSLGLTLCGRMAPSSGTIEICGLTKRSDIQRRAQIAGVDIIDELEPSVTVQDILTEHIGWTKRWWNRLKNADQQDLMDTCGDVYGPRDLPDLKTYVADLSTLDNLLLRIALALDPVSGAHVELLVFNDIEQIHDLADRFVLVDTLARLSIKTPIILTTVNSAVPLNVVSLLPDYYHEHFRIIDVADKDEDNRASVVTDDQIIEMLHKYGVSDEVTEAITHSIQDVMSEINSHEEQVKTPVNTRRQRVKERLHTRLHPGDPDPTEEFGSEELLETDQDQNNQEVES